MNRREFLYSIAATLIPKIIRVNTTPVFDGTWATVTRSTEPLFRPSAAQKVFLDTPIRIQFYDVGVNGGKSYITLSPTIMREYLKIGDPK